MSTSARDAGAHVAGPTKRARAAVSLFALTPLVYAPVLPYATRHAPRRLTKSIGRRP